MVKKTKEGYVIMSEDGKTALSRPYPAERMAKNREKQAKFFKKIHATKKTKKGTK